MFAVYLRVADHVVSWSGFFMGSLWVVRPLCTFHTISASQPESLLQGVYLVPGFLALLCLVVSNVKRDFDLLHGIAPFELIPRGPENRPFVALDLRL
jgi:hypothetical protein